MSSRFFIIPFVMYASFNFLCLVCILSVCHPFIISNNSIMFHCYKVSVFILSLVYCIWFYILFVPIFIWVYISTGEYGEMAYWWLAVSLEIVYLSSVLHFLVFTLILHFPTNIYFLKFCWVSDHWLCCRSILKSEV